ncbi:site-specific integrase [Lactococcus lactis]|uniref:tyrosine-type recombinase/integrase n=2 Tax=Lactococcus lactis TaxID=1358 RepID=UPI0015C2C502|nr:site-specific integrase [Lactococcus lactis]MCM6841704.1 site-specific integrase [Lactococcus lactis]MCM6849370.1 site-specific integrase [Lactococcus lactis]MCM6851502.1 site-specific integrase [Lactococcus lactis]MCM6859232.1 site-specific integrase [Lactococcus lactis]MDH5114213.1 site-specific integrase [Lactococcus lactis]
MATIRYRQRGVKKLWHYEIRDESGKSLAYQGGFKTKRMAQLTGSPIFQEIQKGTTLNSEMTLPQLYKQWYELKIEKSGRSKATLQKYLQYEQKIVEYLDFPLNVITPMLYQKQLNIIGKNVNRGFLSLMTNAIKKAIQMAKADKIFVEDFTIGVEYFSDKTEKLSSEKYLHKYSDIALVLETLRSEMDYKQSVVRYYLYLLFTTGMRPGELLALTWNHVDFENQLLFTDNRVNSSTLEIVAPKTKDSIRYVPINHESIIVLKELKKEQRMTNNELGIKNVHNYVFQHYGLKKEIPTNASSNKILRKVLNSLEIKPVITIYGARHTRATYLITKGLPLDVVAKVLGHSVEELTRTYRHLLSETLNIGFEKIKNL